jgi:hypothetical protein
MVVSTVEHIRFTLMAWLNGILLKQCLGWQLLGERYWCLSVGLDFVRSKIYIIDHNPSWKENQKHKRESFWIRELQTLHPEGINKKT